MRMSYQALFGAALSFAAADAATAGDLKPGWPNGDFPRDQAEAAICDGLNILLGDNPALIIEKDGTDIIATSNIGDMAPVHVRFLEDAGMIGIEYGDITDSYKLESEDDSFIKHVSFSSEYSGQDCYAEAYSENMKPGDTIDDAKAEDLYQRISCGHTTISISQTYDQARLSMNVARVVTKDENGESGTDYLYCESVLDLAAGP